MKGPPAKINVADPQPSRGPWYRYPKEAKRLTAEMLQDMEDSTVRHRLWSPPHSIVLDNGGEFTSQAFQQFCQQHLITLYYTTPYHSQGNAITERLHRTLKTMSATLCQGHPLRWPRLLQTCKATMNAAVHTSTAQHPYFAFFSRPATRVVGTRLLGLPLPLPKNTERIS